jgi:hypothetical protein
MRVPTSRHSLIGLNFPRGSIKSSGFSIKNRSCIIPGNTHRNPPTMKMNNEAETTNRKFLQGSNKNPRDFFNLVTNVHLFLKKARIFIPSIILFTKVLNPLNMHLATIGGTLLIKEVRGGAIRTRNLSLLKRASYNLSHTPYCSRSPREIGSHF